MTTNASVMIQDSFLDKDSLKECIIEFFRPEKELRITEQKYDIVSYRDLCSYGMIVYFEEKVKDDRDSNRDSCISGKNFHFSQQISIEFNSDIPDVEQYVLSVRFCKYLKEKTNSDILFASDILDEICLFHEDKVTFANTETIKLIEKMADIK